MSREGHQAAHRTMGSRAEGGSTALEMVGLIPIVLVLIMALLQAGFSLYGISATQTAARQAARAASLGDSPEAAADTALPGWLDPTVAMVGPGNGVRVSVNLPDVVPGTDLIVDREAILP